MAQARTAPGKADVGSHAALVLRHLTPRTFGDPGLRSHPKSLVCAASPAVIGPWRRALRHVRQTTGWRLVGTLNCAEIGASGVIPCARRRV